MNKTAEHEQLEGALSMELSTDAYEWLVSMPGKAKDLAAEIRLCRSVVAKHMWQGSPFGIPSWARLLELRAQARAE